MRHKHQPAPPGKRRVFCRYFVHPKTKQRIYPKNGDCFSFLVDDG